MAKRGIRKMAPTEGSTGFQRLEIANFSRRLHEIMIEKGLSQSDLARKIWGTIENNQGYTVAKNRDRISVWLRGEVIPDARNMKMLAEALDTELEDLAPDIMAATVDRESPEISMNMIAGHSDKVHLHINKLLPFVLASKIVQMIADQENNG
jgi:transcriptional regulator with XRE-family HTH domain